MEEQHNGYGKKSIWKWVAIYGFVGLIVYGGIYYFYMSKKYSYTQPTTTSTVAKDITGNVPKTDHDNIYTVRTDASKGKHMTDFDGMSLYVFDKDTPNTSNCLGPCIKTWPVYISGASAQGTLPADFSVITRADGSKQFAWMGKPLYYYRGDKQPGDISGDGIEGTWHLISL